MRPIFASFPARIFRKNEHTHVRPNGKRDREKKYTVCRIYLNYKRVKTPSAFTRLDQISLLAQEPCGKSKTETRYSERARQKRNERSRRYVAVEARKEGRKEDSFLYCSIFPGTDGDSSVFCSVLGWFPCLAPNSVCLFFFFFFLVLFSWFLFGCCIRRKTCSTTATTRYFA